MRKNLKKTWICGSTILVTTLISCKADNPANVAKDIITSFSASCSSAGKWSQAAEAQTQSLISVFETLKQVDACKNLGNILADMNAAASQIHGVYGNQSYLEYRQKEEELQELMLTLSSTTDPDLRAELYSFIAQAQVDLANARAKKTLNDSSKNTIGFQDQYSLTSQELGSHFAKLFNHTSDLSACLQQSPGSAVSLFGSLSSIAGSFVSPVLGANMQVVSGMMSTLIGFLRNSRIDKSIWELYDSQMPQALTCGLESMTQFYCQAEDASEIVMRQAESYPRTGEPPENFWKGIDLITRRLPVLSNWLMDVRAGVKPQNTNDADRVNRVREKRLKIDTTNNWVLGALNDSKQKINGTADEQTKQDILVQTVASIAGTISLSERDTRVVNPFAEFQTSPYTYACMLYKGVDFRCPTPGPGDDLRSYIRDLNVTAITVDQIIADFWPQILDRVTRKVILEFNDIIFIDPQLLISQVYEHSVKDVSPMETLKLIRKFLTEFHANSVKNNKTHRLNLITQTLTLVDQAIATIENYTANPNAENLNPLIVIYEVFKLEFGTQFFGERVGEFVKSDLTDRLDAGEIPENLEEILRSGNDEIVHRLTASGYRDLFVIKRDLDRAREQSADNFRIFREFMLEATAKALRGLHKKSMEAGESLADGPYRTYGQSVAHLCLLMYSTGEKWPDKETQNICQGSVLFSVYPDKDSERKIVFRDLPQKLDQYNDRPLLKKRKRTCAYYNFLRAERLYEIMSPSFKKNGMKDQGLKGKPLLWREGGVLFDQLMF